MTLFCVVAFGFGVSAMSGLGVLLRPNSPFEHAGCPGCSVTDRQPDACRRRRRSPYALRLAQILRWRGVSVPLPRPTLVAGQLAISAVDLCLAAAALHVLLPDRAGLSFSGFLPLFCVAIVAGIVSHVPGGLGVFEAVIIFALGDKTAQGALVGALVIYRLIYYILSPSSWPDRFSRLNELRRNHAGDKGRVERVLDLTGEIVPTAASVLVVISGIILLASVVTPMEAARARLIVSIFLFGSSKLRICWAASSPAG